LIDTTSITGHIFELYCSRALSAWGDRIWDFAVPIVFGELYSETLFPAATFAFCSKLLCVLFGPQVGYIVDSKKRLPGNSFLVID